MVRVRTNSRTDWTVSMSVVPTETSTENTRPVADKKPRRAGSSELRREVGLTLRVAAAQAGVRQLLAIAVDENNNSSIENLAVAANVRRSPAYKLLKTLDEIVKADPMEAGILATVIVSGDKEMLRSTWKLLNHLGAEGSARDAGGPAKSGLALARAAQALSPESQKLVQSVLRVLGDE